jgi:hypothetical protein
MSTANKYMQSASGAGGDALNVEGVFSTYLYIGNGSTQTITNGIDLDGEGGLVWIKSRSHSYPHNLYDTERGATKRLKSASTVAESTLSTGLTAFSSTGFTLGGDNDTNGTYSDAQYASWTFRKAPKFFDVVTYTGTGSNLTINHNLGSVPGCIIIKCTSAVKSWVVYHRGVNGGVNPEDYALFLNTTSAQNDNLYFQDTAPTSTQFFLGDSAANENGQTHVAYLFAHNDGDGEFGPDGDADIIKCGSYTGNGSTTGPEIDSGFEPQWLLIKRTSGSEEWLLFDVMRGIPTGGYDPDLRPAQSNAENTDRNWLDLTSTGFQPKQTSNHINGNGENYIYIAIRRGTAVPESATEVFDIDVSTASQPYSVTTSLNYVDATINRVRTSGQAFLHNRLTGSKWMFTDSTNAESNSPNDVKYDFNGKVMPYFYTSGNSHVNYMWKRAPGFFDVVAYTGTNVAGLTINHNLGVVPEMIWVKNRSASEYWAVYHKDLNGGTNPSHYFLKLNDTNAETDYNEIWNDTEPTDTQFTVGQQGVVNGFEKNQIAYLFASLPGISKVGSYTGNGSTLNIDCGFTSGARFVLIKAVSTSGSWYVLDTARGIVAGNDPVLSLNTTDAEEAYDDLIDPYSAGFTLNGVGMVNANTVNYIFYAIA